MNEQEEDERPSPLEGSFGIEDVHPGHVQVFFEISTRQGWSSEPAELQHHRVLYMTVDATKDYIEIHPIGVWPLRTNFLSSRYGTLETIVLEGFGFDVPKSVDDVKGLVESFPMGFVKDTTYALGLKKEYAAIAHKVSSLPGVTCLVISTRQATHLSSDVFFLAYGEFESMRKAMNRIASRYQAEARMDKSILVHNSLLSRVAPKVHPPEVRPYRPDTVFKLVKSHDMVTRPLSSADAEAVVELVTKKAQDIAKEEPRTLMRLRTHIELVTLREFIVRFESMLSSKLKESHWQRFFEEHVFVLNLVFSFAVVKVGQQVTVGGMKMSGGGAKFADFVVRHERTGNVALIEIKTPDAALLGRKEYRPGVYPPAVDLSGGVNQLLDQRYQFQRSAALLKETSRQHELESYAVHCVLVVGMLPSDPDQLKSFELIRHGTKDVQVVTFDELFAKVRSLAEFLTTCEAETTTAETASSGAS